ncbi:ubiquitin C-terminal hydrolase L3 [Coprinopsis marcescibilis]|uniref:Ubiquitin carboxyl-terminal hydrolase n=1 Tax=Coprinopsis marcescibilis TaxID=230819 RepID=A0A5C3KTR3_COPMA|nr:ubiquitin C-terminal hydrolase L3 [Coprinopsis marcescibilis]
MSESNQELSIYDRTVPNYRKHYVPLESDPAIFTDLARRLGVKGYEFHDVLSLDDPDLLAFIPRPVLALILVFPVSDKHDAQVKEQEKRRTVYAGRGEAEPVVWFAQTIQNACGLYAILHALSNTIGRSAIETGSALDNLLKECVPLTPDERVLALESSSEVETAHAAAASQGGTAPPAADAKVDFHYICFARSTKNNHIYELNGTVKGPIDLGEAVEGEDLLSKEGIKVFKEYIAQVAPEGQNIGFSLLALTAA